MPLICFILLMGGLFLPIQSLAQPPTANRPTPVRVTPVKWATFETTLEALGTTQANESVEISATITATVRAIHFTDGMRINAGTVLVQLDDTIERAKLLAAQVDVDEQRREYQRINELVKRNALPRLELDTQFSRLKNAEAAFEVIQAQLKDYTLIAPFSGIVGLRRVSVGALIRPGTVITTLDDLSVIKVDFSVAESFLNTLKVGQLITAHSIAYPTQSFQGKVTTLDSRIDPISRSILIRAEIPNSDNLLRAGMLMTIRLIKSQRQGLMLPEAALVPTGSQQFVFIVNDKNQAERREVILGQRNVGNIEIIEGVTEGMQVITEGVLQVRHLGEVKILP